MLPMSHNVVKRLSRIAGSQQDLARILGLSPEHVSRIINGHTPVPKYMEVLADLIDVVKTKDLPDYWQGMGEGQ